MIQENKIDCEDEVKLLGVTFDFKLTFNSHVSHICKNASQQLNVLKRIGNNLSKLGKLTIYYSFILSSCKYTGVCLFIILKTSIAMERNLLNLSEGNCDFSSKFS
jgi:hypothetical protein